MGRHHARVGQGPQLLNEIVVRALRLDAVAREIAKNLLEPIEARENDGNSLRRNRCSVAIVVHERFGGMRELGQSR